MIVGQPPCPHCGAPRIIDVRHRRLAATCGQRRCRGKQAAQTMGPEHFKRMGAAGGRHRKPRIRSEDYQGGYNAGYVTGTRHGFKAGYDAAVAERGQQ